MSKLLHELDDNAQIAVALLGSQVKALHAQLVSAEEIDRQVGTPEALRDVEMWRTIQGHLEQSAADTCE